MVTMPCVYTDNRFLSQFKAGKITKFIPYSKYPACYKDVSFWLPQKGMHPNDVYEVGNDKYLKIPSANRHLELLQYVYANNICIFIHKHICSVYAHIQLIRDNAGDIVESVQLFDEFTNKKTGKVSHAYRVNYRHMDRSLTNEEVDAIQLNIRNELVTRLGVELR
jgi:phenylalanyl-tRNA synthetase alpha chain